MDVDEEEQEEKEPKKTFKSLMRSLGNTEERCTIVLELNLDQGTLYRAMRIAKSRNNAKDRERNFIGEILERTSFLHMKVIDFDVPK